MTVISMPSCVAALMRATLFRDVGPCALQTTGSSMNRDEVISIYEEFSALQQQPLPTISNTAVAGTIRHVCTRPEFSPLLPEIEFRTDKSMGLPFRVPEAHIIILDEAAIGETALTAFHLRHALELTTLLHLFPAEHRNTIAIVAIHTALSYYAQLMDYEKDLIEAGVDAWMKPLLAFATEGRLLNHPIEQVYQHLSGFLNQLLPLQCTEYNDSLNVANRSIPLLPFAHPIERLLTLGGDDRLYVQSHTGLNQYGCSPRPRPWAITFSSSTASSISDYGYGQAEALRQRLLVCAAKGDLVNCYHEEAQAIREELSQILNLTDSGTEVILTSSGTDGELFGLYFTAGDAKTSVLNILVGPAEIGGGSVAASSGCHFSTSTPLGGEVEPGAPLAGMYPENVRVEHIPIRRDNGDVIPLEESEALIRNLTASALTRGETILIHLLDSSKTGLLVPGLACAKQLRESAPGKVHILVDAAQLRVSRRLLNRYLAEGFMVLITGSKFFTGPPFSAALLIPESIVAYLNKLAHMPVGFSDYATAHDFPPRLRHLGNQLSGTPNIGLLFRWQAALWEMSAFFAVPPQNRVHTIKQFGQAVLKTIEQTPELTFVAAPRRHLALCDDEHRWDCLPGIFTFYLHATVDTDSTPCILTYDEAQHAYAYLNQDISDLLPADLLEDELEIARHRCHSGQPVRIRKRSDGSWLGGLRIAAGARLVSGVCFDPMLGQNPTERLAREIHDMQLLLAKLAIIGRNWHYIIQAEQKEIARCVSVFR
jgi:hypothetical protein